MTAVQTRTAWDFTPVFELINSLKARNEAANKGHKGDATQQALLQATTAQPEFEEGVKLGNFNKIWDSLGVQRDVPTLQLPHFGVSTTKHEAPSRDAYLSDGPLYYPPSSKSVKWRDDEEGHDLTDVQPISPDEPRLNKNQRKKRNRKLRKKAEREQHPEDSGFHSAPEDADVSESSPPQRPQDSPSALKKKQKKDGAGLPKMLKAEPVKPYDLNESTKTPKSNDAQSQQSTPPKTAQNAAASHPVAISKPSSMVPTATFDAIKEAREKVAAALSSSSKTTTLSTSPTTPIPKRPAPAPPTVHESLQRQVPKADPHASYLASKGQQNGHKSSGFALPSTPLPPKTKNFPTAPQTEPVKSNGVHQAAKPPLKQSGFVDAMKTQVIPTRPHVPRVQGSSTPTTARHEILPLINQTSIDRNWSLFLKLIHNFPSDRKYLVSPLQLTINKPVENGIHVFVDASNIMIGFMEHLKRARGIRKLARVPRVDLNFHALALLLERRRPITKRVLAGSTPEVAAFEEARQVGYETCILDKVYKARELTERQKYFEGYSSGGDAAAAASATRQPKWVEQAVDEILHLKICESVIDTETPEDAGDTASETARPTMVLATGDAAEAEYSPGFLKMVERALKKGWNVEVMAFGKSVSMGYRNMQRLPMERGGWGERFKIIELDEYAEELFGESM